VCVCVYKYIYVYKHLLVRAGWDRVTFYCGLKWTCCTRPWWKII